MYMYICNLLRFLVLPIIFKGLSSIGITCLRSFYISSIVQMYYVYTYIVILHSTELVSI